MITFYDNTSKVDKHYTEYAEQIAQQSPDLSTKTGAVLVGPCDRSGSLGVLAEGYNRLPIGVLLKSARLERPEKYLWTVHSEVVALGSAARVGIMLSNATLYSNWFPCAECARAIIEHGIKRVVAVQPDTTHPKYGHEFEVALELLREAGVEVTFIGERVQVQK